MTNAPMTNIILIGFRGTGKSTISTLLAERLGMKRVSTDERATERCGMSIRDFVEQHGWAAFRQIEQECIREAIQEQGIVIDCGGGVVENVENMRLLSGNGIVAWVHAELGDVLERLMANEQDAQRPTLTVGMTQAQDITQNYQRRLPLYEQYAVLTVNTSMASAEECCRAIISSVSM